MGLADRRPRIHFDMFRILLRDAGPQRLLADLTRQAVLDLLHIGGLDRTNLLARCQFKPRPFGKKIRLLVPCGHASREGSSFGQRLRLRRDPQIRDILPLPDLQPLR